MTFSAGLGSGWRWPLMSGQDGPGSGVVGSGWRSSLPARGGPIVDARSPRRVRP